MENNTRKILINHFEKYPLLQLEDLFKFLHQSSFGCEHMVSSRENATSFIREEFLNVPKNEEPLTESLDGEYSRVHLSHLNKGLSAETLGKLFFLSATKEKDGTEKLKEKINCARELVAEKILPFSVEEFEAKTTKWEKEGFCALHHSEKFRNEYKPAYRVVKNKFLPFLSLFAEIDKMLEKGRVVLAIEGTSASGKTTLGKILEEVYGGTIFHMDDFFLRPEQRTPERYMEIGGNVDRERFFEEVIIPLKENKTINYRKFDCSTMSLLDPLEIKPERMTVVEGAYSMHPFFGEYYNLSVLIEISPERQKERILKRNSPDFAERFFNEWIPLEKEYFSKTNVKTKADLVIETE